MVDDHQFTIDGLQVRLADCTDIELVAHASTVADLFAEPAALDLVVLDLRLRDGSSPTGNVEAIRQHGVPVLVLTSGEDPYLVREAARAGVLGVIRKSRSPEEIVDAIRAAVRGEVVPTTDWAAAIDGDPEIDLVDLSPQHRKVLELYAAGETATRVASDLKISRETVNDYLRRIRTKYADAGRPAPTKSELYKRALEDGWLPFPRRRKK
ncbi:MULTISPECIES: response regulator transcription factor [Nocardiaceae]|uniref:Response regulator transcription factor n=1 Tax=Rhodococcoides kroppenstedtii TaxID=293050 RepID=A0ABS7NPH7_9NOCA|nr:MULTISPECIES: response regulator transcription factor [Rhodococcus]AMY17991.1 Transcriptional regulatory protein DesR [Rhodococcus sp. PBTS 1]MBY6313673.1 response regulator transcription factor [Rhodococcus kroppenstedtii]MBY6319904.1 response regulator transcription factor [Rhodococcus kroppenstedtii]MBY6398843.1 response regulator transcription factor [Rhodococcus kroppenstedtii]